MDIRFCVLVHDEKRLFYVSSHRTDVKARMGWKRHASQARSKYKLTYNYSVDGSIIAMVNTNYSGWRDVFPKGEYTAENNEYAERKMEIISYWERAGYRNCGINLKTTHFGCKGNGSGRYWNSKWNVINMTRNKIYEKIDQINVSLQMMIPSYVYGLAYREAVSLLPTVDYPVDNMVSLLRFIREKMGLETNELKVAA